MQLLAVVFALGLLDLGANLVAATVDRVLLTGTLHDGRVLGVDDDFLRDAQIGHLNVFELHAQVFEDRLAAGEDRNVFQHRLATITVARGLHGTDLDDAAHLVDDQSRQSLALNVFGDDEQLQIALRDLFEQRHEVASVRDLLFVNQNAAVFEHAFLSVLIGDEVRREITSLELHAFDEVDLGINLAAFFDGDDAVLANLDERLGQLRSNVGVVVAGDGRNRFEFLTALRIDRLGELLQMLDHGFNRRVDSASHRHRISARRDELDAFAKDRFSENGGRGRAVTRDRIGLRGDLFDQLGSHVLERVTQFDVLGDGNAVLGHLRSTPALVEDCVASARPQRAGDSPRQLGSTFQQALASVFIENQ